MHRITLNTDDLRALPELHAEELKRFVRRLDPRRDPALLQMIIFQIESPLDIYCRVMTRTMVADPPRTDPALIAEVRQYETDAPLPGWLVARPATT